MFSQKEGFLIFWKQKPQKVPYISGNGNYILGNGRPKRLLLLQEVTFGAQKIMHHSEKPSYILGNKSF